MVVVVTMMTMMMVAVVMDNYAENGNDDGGVGVWGYRSIYFPFQIWVCVVRLANSCSSLSSSCY